MSTGVIADQLIVRSPKFSMLMAVSAHDMWFRLLKDELSLKREYGFMAQYRNGGNRRIFGKYRQQTLVILLVSSDRDLLCALEQRHRQEGGRD